jgi:hypothetical protein
VSEKGHPGGTLEAIPVTAAPVAGMACRPRCAACCIAPSISSPIPGMPNGKPAGVPCIQLDAQRRCRIFGDPRRPPVCSALQPSEDLCSDSADSALAGLTGLERATAPGDTL